MTTYNTGNPIGSTAVKDLYDNAENFDDAVNGSAQNWVDRLGRSRRSLQGFEDSAAAVLAGAGYLVPVPYEAGLDMATANQTVSYNGETYAPIQSFLPFSTSGTFETSQFRLIQGIASADLAAAGGATNVGVVSEFADTVARTVADVHRESRSVLEWLSNAERNSVRNGDSLIDLTAAIQRAASSGAPGIDMHDYMYRIDGTVELPVSGLFVTGQGWLAQRGSGIVNNGGKMFSAVNPTGLIEFENGEIVGNVDRLGPGYSSFAIGLWVENSNAGVVSRNMKISGFSTGLYAKQVNGVSVIGGEYTGNILTGISGFANNVTLEDSSIYANGFSGSSGLTHDVYFINSKNGVIRDCYIGDSLDTTTTSLAIRTDVADASPGFDSVSNWNIHDNSISKTGVLVRSDPSGGTNRPPVDKINIYDNTFLLDASLRVDDAQDSKSWGNTGIGEFSVSVSSSIPGYVAGFESDSDECAYVREAVVAAKIAEARERVVFKNTTINNGSSEAFRTIAGLGGFPACTIIEPRLTGTGPVFDSAFASRYAVNLGVNVQAASDLKYLDRTNIVLSTDNPFTPDLNQKRTQPFSINATSAVTTINSPTLATSGQVLELYFRNVAGGANRTLSFSPEYKLTANTLATINTNPGANSSIFLRFIFEAGSWRQMGDASWTAL